MPFFPLALQQHICYLQHICWGMQRNRFFFIFSPFPFSTFLSFCVRDWPSTGLASSLNTSEKASSRWAIFTMEKCRCRKFCSLFYAQISEHFRAYRNLHWANHSDPCHGKDLFLLHNWCRSKAMTSQVEQRSMLVTAGCGRYRRQWVKKSAVCISQLVCILPQVRSLQFAECVLYWPGNEGTSYIS